MKGLDAYITGQNIRGNELVPHICPVCSSIKRVPMFFEMGGWFYENDNDPFCEPCDTEMVLLEAVKTQPYPKFGRRI